MAISFGRFAFLKLTDFTDFCNNSVACETFLWYDNVCKFKELANAQIAQLVEQRTENPRVAGSIPALGIFLYLFFAHGWLEKAWAFFYTFFCSRLVRKSLGIFLLEKAAPGGTAFLFTRIAFCRGFRSASLLM